MKRLRVAALVLAAGTSSRMRGRHKLLLPVDGVLMVRRSVLGALASRVSKVLVVVGHREGEVRAALSGLDVAFVSNELYAGGISTSLRAGLEALDDAVDGVVVCLADMPFVTAGDIDALLAAFEGNESRSIVVPVRGDRRGNPVVWPRAFLPALAALEGDTGGRGLLASNSESILRVPLENDAVLLDMDTQEDFAENGLTLNGSR